MPKKTRKQDHLKIFTDRWKQTVSSKAGVSLEHLHPQCISGTHDMEKKIRERKKLKKHKNRKKKILSYGVQQNVICAHSNLQSYLLFLYIFENLLSFFSLLCIISLLAFFPPLFDRKMLLNIFLLIFILFQTFSLFPSSLQ